MGIFVGVFFLNDSFAQELHSEKLKFLGNKNIAPVVYLQNGVPAGVAVDIVRALEKHMPKAIEIEVMDWTEAQKLVAKGEADALIQINQTEERVKIYDFSELLLESQFSIFTRGDKMGISGLSGLRGLRVGVEAGGLPDQVLKNSPFIKLTKIPDFIGGFKLLREAEIDAVIVDYRVGSYILAENDIRNIKVSGEPIAMSYSAFAVKKGNAKLLNDINNALKIIKEDGTYQSIINKWTPKEGVFRTKEQIDRIFYSAVIVVVFMMLLITVAWTVTLMRELRRRRRAEEKLGEQYFTLLGIIDNTDALIYSVDRNYRYACFNQGHADAMKAFCGMDIQKGHSILEYIPESVKRENVKRNLDRALVGERVHIDEFWSEQCFQTSFSPICTDTEIIGVAVFAHDISERARKNEELYRANRELKAISEFNQILMRSEDEATLLKDVCRIICDGAGYRMAWVGYADNDDAMIVRPMAWAGYEEGYLSDANITWANTEWGRGASGLAMRNGEGVSIVDFETDPRAIPWRDIALRRGYRSSVALPLKDENSKVFGVLNIYSSVPNAFTPVEMRLLSELSDDLAFGIVVLRARAEYKKTEESLRRINERFLLATTAARVGVWDWDIRKNILVWDDIMYELYGVRREDFNGAYEAWLKGLHPDDRAESDEISRLARLGKQEYDTEFRVIWPNGIIHYLKAYGQIVRDADGMPLRMTGINFDITERVETEKELRKLNEELEKRVKDRTVELENANLDLENMNRLFVGRELRMKELKARIAKLEGGVYE
ncbi:MAG: hypothetical protein A2413_07615 [Treponema sp. RIFOXYC1_FULL_61_9]|nr:MAG: hypothetical protein A2413_07615 [Treponema sp. RIFOXYC1_FULL_61_9]